MNIIDIDKGVKLATIKNEKFKTFLIAVSFIRDLKRDEVTKNALLSDVMIDKTNKYQSIKEISRRLDELYGLSVSASVSKIGEKERIVFKFLSVNDKYLDEDIFCEVLEFMKEMILNPYVKDGGFSKEVVELEKNNLKEQIKAQINDKRAYARRRCIEIMCKDEAFSISKDGYEEDVDNIDEKVLYEHYLNIINTSQIFITVEGDLEEKTVQQVISEKLKFPRTDILVLEKDKKGEMPKEVKSIVEDMSINQGKGLIGFRCDVDYKNLDEYFAFIIGNSIFGGGAHSKLFLNVREKESLCYSIGSSIIKTKSILLVEFGIEKDNFEKTIDLIRKELVSLNNGDFSDEDIENSKKSLINAIKMAIDSLAGESAFSINQHISGVKLSVDEFIERVSNVKKEEIINVMNKLKEDTIYFLK